MRATSHESISGTLVPSFMRSLRYSGGKTWNWETGMMAVPPRSTSGHTVG